MRTSRQFRTAALLVIGAAVPSFYASACASEGEFDGPVDDRDGGLGESSAGDGPVDQRVEDVGVDAGPCSAAKICRIEAPVAPEDHLLSVWGSSATDIWAVGSSGLILHYDGDRWEAAERVGPTDASATNFTMRGVWAGARDNVWIIGGEFVQHTTGWKGPKTTEWSFYRSIRGWGCHNAAVRGIAQAVWVSGSCGDWMMRFDGSEFDGGEPFRLQGPSNMGDKRPLALSMTSDSEMWLATYDTQSGEARKSHIYRLHLAGTAGDPPMPDWQTEEFDSYTRRSVRAIWSHEQIVWFAGEYGTLLRLDRANPANKTLEAVTGPTSEDLNGVFGFGADDVWAVGDASTVLHWDGIAWKQLATPFDHAKRKPHLQAVWGTSPADVWIVGDGTVLHYQENNP